MSDLHIDPNNPSESLPVFHSLCEKIGAFRTANNMTFDLLIISGDLVDKGASNYNHVAQRISEICFAAGLDEKQVLIVPGNHDICWEKCKISHHSAVSFLKENPRSFASLEKDVHLKDALTEVFNDYLTFSMKYPLLNNETGFPGFFHTDIKTRTGIDISLCGLNTALVAGPDDKGKTDQQLRNRVVGMPILAKMLSPEQKLKLVVSHYPLSWINDIEQKEVLERLQQSSGTIYFHGHIHAPNADILGISGNIQCLSLGAGSLYSEKWEGSKHCQILEFDFSTPSLQLHEWFWFNKVGWRAFEPIDIDWAALKFLKNRDGIIQGGEEEEKVPSQDICKQVGLVNINNGRENSTRYNSWEKAIDSAADGSEFIVIGRSLIDWSRLSMKIEDSIKNRGLHFKLALLDENSILKKNNQDRKEEKIYSWIEMPIPGDWAINDVQTSMRQFRNIKVEPNTGSLEVFGLPFYSSHSFISYTNRSDQKRYCSEEVGMALEKKKRPCIELKAISDDSYASILENMYKGILTDERRLLFNNGTSKIESNITNRSKIIAPKIESLGLVDISIGRSNIDWLVTDIGKIIEDTPDEGDIFIVGRTLIIWGNNQRDLANAILQKKLNCTLIIADPRIPDLKSLVEKDYAQNDLKAVWNNFKTLCDCLYQQKKNQQTGSFKLYGIPAYIPETFGSYINKNGEPYCTIEIGIGVGPTERVIIYFKKVTNSKKDVYSNLNKIYRGIIEGREPILAFPSDKKNNND